MAAVLVALVVTSCDSAPPRPEAETPSARTAPSPLDPTPPASPAPTEGATANRPHPVRAADLDPSVAERAVRLLAGTIGPRPTTGPAFRRAVTWVSSELRGLGYDVRRQRFAVPDGVSWGIPVPAGRSVNVVATRPGTDLTKPYLLVGAHLDTVPQAPGAEDNASGVGVLLAVAAAAGEGTTRLPLVLVAFGAEEPRGPTDDDHHYGSRAWVTALPAGQRRALRGMLSLDRVGVGSRVPVCSATGGADAAQAQALRAGRRAGVPTVACVNRSSDHWSFVRAGLPGVRLGGTPYAGYHSAADVPGVVSRAQLGRAGRLVLAWLGRG